MKKRLMTCTAAFLIFSGCGLPGPHNSPGSTGNLGLQNSSPEEINSTADTLGDISLLPEALLNERYDQVYNSLSTSFRSQVTKEQIKELSQSFFETGDVFNIQSKYAINDMVDYVWVNPSGSKGISAMADQDDVIWGLQIINLSAFPETDSAYTKQEYSLPFKGNWFTFWGGNNTLLNYHYDYETQRYAYDFLVLENGASYTGDPTRNESFYAFSQDVLAPADGIVLEVMNDVEDNIPVGTMNEKEAAGNYVIIDHQGEYSILAHFKKGSIIVQEGQEVKRGEPLGMTGNSGNSSEAHIHFQVSDQPSLEHGKALRIKFKNGLDPIKGQWVEG